ncbi:MAG: aminotransferase class I/II-fold pyridoxal phosphate-dependent enzyme, partial [bacterium]
MIKLIELNKQHKNIKHKILRKISSLIDNSEFILGKEVELFEEEFATYCNRRYAIGVNSGTDALLLSLLTLDLQKNDEVIIPAFTFFADAAVIERINAKVIFVDIDRRTFNIDLEDLKNKITKNSKVIIPTHLFGLMND